MELTLLFDHRFFRDSDGVIFSNQNYNYDLFASRYLPVFDRVLIAARVSDQSSVAREGRTAVGRRVRLFSLGNWHGPAEFIIKMRGVQRRLERLLQFPNAVIMFAPSTIGSLAYQQCLRSGRPFGLEVIGDPGAVFGRGVVKHPLRAVFRWWFERHLRLQCATASAVSYVTAEALQHRYPPSEAAYSTHYSAVELPEEAFASGPRSASRTGNPFRIVSVGSLQQLYKGPDVLLEAIRQSLQRDVSFSLVWVGGGQYQQQLESLAEVLGVANRVSFVGQIPAGGAVRAILDDADLFVLPSRTEGLPSAMIEAMARALPCIGTSVGGIRELLPKEDLVPPDNPQALAEMLVAVANDKERLSRMSRRNLIEARKYHKDVLQLRRDDMYSFLLERTAEWFDEVT